MSDKTTLKKTYAFTNDLMFCHVLSSRPDLAKSFLETILNIKIDSLKVVESQKTLNYSPDVHSIRLDVCLKGSKDVFDVEMQLGKARDIEKRMRYYQSVITAEDLKSGEDYKKLKNCYIIFICEEDPFSKGDVLYRFSMKCENHDDVFYDDGAHNVVFCYNGFNKRISEELKNLQSYLKTGEVFDNLTNELHNEVEKTNRNEVFRRKTMTIEEKLRMVAEDAREEGVQIGLEKGKQEGIKEGIQKGIKEGKQEGIQEGEYRTILSNIQSLISTGVAENEEEACKFLRIDPQVYLTAKETQL